VHLRNKAVYVTGDMKSVDDPEESCGHCWCNRTQHIVGPDQQGVDRQSCVAGRQCYQDS
jgi:hypothetical protein